MYRTTELKINVYDKLTPLFSGSDNYNKFTSTFLSLFTKYDFRDYYYSKGFETEITSEVFPSLILGIGYISKTDKSAINNSDFSFFYKNKKYKTNRTIYDSNINAIKLNYKLDFRKFIEDGFFRRRITPRTYIMFDGSALISKTEILKSQNDFAIYELGTYGSFPTAYNWVLQFNATKIISTGSVPFQMLYAFPGNISAAGKNNSFRTLRIGEVFGDQATQLFLNHSFSDDFFTYLQIPYIKDLQLQLEVYLNMAMSDISNKSELILEQSTPIFKKPFYELGFSIGHLLVPITFEFTWKLNYRGHNNFVFGINTFAL